MATTSALKLQTRSLVTLIWHTDSSISDDAYTSVENMPATTMFPSDVHSPSLADESGISETSKLRQSLASLFTTGGQALPAIADEGGGRTTATFATELTTAFGQLTIQQEPPELPSSHPIWLISLLCFLVAICVAIVVIWFARCRGPYRRLAIFKEHGYDYIYRPQGVLDDEYENTFVGVSMPLLQDITII